MGLVSHLKSLLKRGSKVDVRQRFAMQQESTSGTMSTFSKVRDVKSGHIVGLKILDPQKTADFENLFKGMNKPGEGEIGSQLNHPNIVRTIEFGKTTDNRDFIVLEYLSGEALNSMIVSKSEPLRANRLSLIRQAAEALAAVHEAGFTHRDICPRNFIVGKNFEWIKLIDFGLTLPAEERFFRRAGRSGLPRYLAPEVLRMKAVDQRADIFSFGITAYEVCAFHHPWTGVETSAKAALDHDTNPPVDLLQYEPSVDPLLATTIMSCLEIDIDKRPRTMGHFLRMIRSIQQDTPK